MAGFVWRSNLGCLLPFLIIFNFFFGRLIFNSTRLWLGMEAILILIFILKINIMAQKISQQLRSGGRSWVSDKPKSHSFKSNGKIIDVQAQVIQDKEELK